jgi:hypothetical protein
LLALRRATAAVVSDSARACRARRLGPPAQTHKGYRAELCPRRALFRARPQNFLPARRSLGTTPFTASAADAAGAASASAAFDSVSAPPPGPPMQPPMPAVSQTGAAPSPAASAAPPPPSTATERSAGGGAAGSNIAPANLALLQQLQVGAAHWSDGSWPLRATPWRAMRVCGVCVSDTRVRDTCVFGPVACP